MSNTTNLQLPLLEAAQAQKHVTVNEALQQMDACVQLAVKDKDFTSPPGSPSDGDRYIVGASATGTWAAHDEHIAAYQDGVWVFYVPREGWLAWIDDENKVYAYAGSAWVDVTALGGNALKAMPTVSNNSSDADHDIDISAGDVSDVDGAQVITLATTLVKRLDAAWAVGTNAGGLDTGTVAADTAYAVWIIRRSDTGVVDALLSTAFTSSSVTLPTHYDQLQLIGAVHTDSSSNIRAFRQYGEWFYYLDLVSSINDSTMTHLVYETGTLDAPPDSIVHINGRAKNTTAGNLHGFYLRQVGSTGGYETFNGLSGTNEKSVTSTGFIGVDGSSQMEYAVWEASGAVTAEINTLGFLLQQRGAAF